MANLLSTAGFSGTNGSHFELQLYYDISQSVEGNYSDITYYLKMQSKDGYSGSGASCNGYIGGTWVGSFNSIGRYSTIDIGSRTVREYHNADGTKTAGFSADINTPWDLGNAHTDGSFTLPRIDRFAIMTDATNNPNDESEFWFKYNNPRNLNLFAWLEINPNGEHLATRNLTNVGTSGTYTWELTEIEREQLRAKLPNTNSGIIRIGITSTIGSYTQASYKDKNFTIVNANPTFNNFDFEDTNATTVALTGSTTNNVINVNGYSNIQATIKSSDKAQAIKGASMSKYRFSISGSTPIEISYSSDSNVSGTINNSKDGIYNIYAIDSRNNSTLVTKQATSIIDYANITFDKQNCSFVRNNNQVGEYAILTINGTFWGGNFGQVVNSIKTATYKFKKSDSSTWIDGVTPIINNIQVSGNSFSYTGMIASDNQDTTWDLDANYNLEVTISDELSSTTIDNLILNSAIPTMCLDKSGVAIMGAYDSSVGGSFQVDGIDVMDHFMTKVNATTDANGWTVIDNPTAPYIEYYKSETSAINLPTGITWQYFVVSNLPVGVSFNDNIYVWGSVQCWDSALIPTLSINSNNKIIINAVWLFGGNGWSNNHKWYARIVKMR